MIPVGEIRRRHEASRHVDVTSASAFFDYLAMANVLNTAIPEILDALDLVREIAEWGDAGACWAESFSGLRDRARELVPWIDPETLKLQPPADTDTDTETCGDCSYTLPGWKCQFAGETRETPCSAPAGSTFSFIRRPAEPGARPAGRKSPEADPTCHDPLPAETCGTCHARIKGVCRLLDSPRFGSEVDPTDTTCGMETR